MIKRMLLTLSLIIALCSTESSFGEQKPNTITPGIAIPSTATPSVTTPSVIGPNITTPEIQAPEIQVPEIDAPSETNETLEVADCEATYQKLLSRFGKDYSPCDKPEITLADTCQKPTSLADQEDLKQNVNIQLILDSSGSMIKMVSGGKKIDVAKQALTEFINTLPEKAKVSLRVYGHVGSNDEKDKEKSCASSDLIYSFQTIDKEKFKTVINSFQPTGWTAIANSLLKAKEDFAQFDSKTNSNIIYLVTDGIETCDENPVVAAKALYESDIQTIVNVVGFDVDSKASQQLMEIAQNGGGKYYEARNAEELRKIFREDFNWLEWTSYYNCKLLTYTNYSNRVLLSQTTKHSCILLKATTEYNNILLEVNKNPENYQECKSHILEKAVERRESLVEKVRQEKEEKIDAAREEKERAIEDAARAREKAKENAQ